MAALLPRAPGVVARKVPDRKRAGVGDGKAFLVNAGALNRWSPGGFVISPFWRMWIFFLCYDVPVFDSVSALWRWQVAGKGVCLRPATVDSGGRVRLGANVLWVRFFPTCQS